ncbi:hypothetical protein C8Q78DRAFT_638934 [Trametes maxima]|nr:hypothetical protein C8Q78DRAFT_638934 [Trametes maxima]
MVRNSKRGRAVEPSVLSAIRVCVRARTSSSASPSHPPLLRNPRCVPCTRYEYPSCSPGLPYKARTKPARCSPLRPAHCGSTLPSPLSVRCAVLASASLTILVARLPVLIRYRSPLRASASGRHFGFPLLIWPSNALTLPSPTLTHIHTAFNAQGPGPTGCNILMVVRLRSLLVPRTMTAPLLIVLNIMTSLSRQPHNWCGRSYVSEFPYAHKKCSSNTM